MGGVAWRTLLACDFETYHSEDYKADGHKLKREGGHLIVEGEEFMPTMVKCASIVKFDLRRTTTHNMIRHISDVPVSRICVDTLDEYLMLLCEEKHAVVYFHNLTYDEFFIADRLLRNDGKITLPNGYTVRCKARKINRNGKVLYAKYEFRQHSGKKDKKTFIEFRDSLQIYHNELRDIAKMVGMEKGDEAISIGMNDAIREYCINDSEICGKAMIHYFNICRQRTHGRRPFGWMTSASTAYGLWKLYAMGRMRYTEDQYNRVFSDEGHPPWLRDGFKGASPLLDPSVRWRILPDVSTFDVNSMYPYQLSTQALPVGSPEPFTDDDLHDSDFHFKGYVWCAKVRIHARVMDGHRACFLIKHRDENGDTLIAELNEWEEHYITEADYLLLKENYDIFYFQIVEGYRYHAVKGIPAKFIRDWYRVKAEAKAAGDKAMVTFAKIILNSLYGKFGSNDEFDEFDYELGIDDRIHVVCTGVSKSKTHYYLPWAVWTTAYSRLLITRAINAVGWDHVCYTDTDSIHCHGLDREEIEARLNSIGINCTPYELGDFKYENKCKLMGVYIQNKWYAHAYAEEYEGHQIGEIEEFKSAGANIHNVRTIDDVRPDMDIAQLRAFKVPGGKILFPQPIDMSADATVTRHKVKGLSEEASELWIQGKQQELLDKYLESVDEMNEDKMAYLKDVRYDEKDRYWKKYPNRAYVKQQYEEMKMYGDR